MGSSRSEELLLPEELLAFLPIWTCFLLNLAYRFSNFMMTSFCSICSQSFISKFTKTFMCMANPPQLSYTPHSTFQIHRLEIFSHTHSLFSHPLFSLLLLFHCLFLIPLSFLQFLFLYLPFILWHCYLSLIVVHSAFVLLPLMHFEFISFQGKEGHVIE